MQTGWHSLKIHGRALSQIPRCSWQHPIGQGWEDHYIVRYASNLDDGPNHGAPLGGFGAGCIGRAPSGHFNLWHLDGGEHIFQTFPACQFSVFEQQGDTRHTYALATEAPTDGTLGRWQWYPASGQGSQGSGESGSDGMSPQSPAGRLPIPPSPHPPKPARTTPSTPAVGMSTRTCLRLN
jgi:non-lysosomal glucosylceramidase